MPTDFDLGQFAVDSEQIPAPICRSHPPLIAVLPAHKGRGAAQSHWQPERVTDLPAAKQAWMTSLWACAANTLEDSRRTSRSPPAGKMSMHHCPGRRG
jgi:hypothetical protein